MHAFAERNSETCTCWHRALSAAGVRHMLHVQVQVKKNGAYLALATAHCTASKEERPQRSAEMEVIWGALEALTVDGCVFAGDTNMHADEGIRNNIKRSGMMLGRWMAPTQRCRERGVRTGWTRRIRG